MTKRTWCVRVRKSHKSRREGVGQGASTCIPDLVPLKVKYCDRGIGLAIFDARSATHSIQITRAD